MLTGKLSKWQILLNEFYIVYITQKAIKGQALANHLAENPVDRDYEPLTTYFPNEEVLFAREDIAESYPGWRMFFDGAANFKGVGIGEVLILKSEQHYPLSAKIRFPRTIIWLNTKRASLGLGWRSTYTLKNFWRTPDLGLLRCVDVAEATRLFEEIHAGMCGPYMNGFTLAKKILRVGYFWITMESDSIRYAQKYHQCQIHVDFIRVPPNELNVMGSPWPFATWVMDVIGPIDPATSNRHYFILVAIYYFTKWVKASTYKAVTKKVVADFVQNNIVCRFGTPESIITDNAINLNSDLMREIYEKFRIDHRNSTTYIPQMNGVVEAANKNIKRIL
ncbi:uncharacterized protein [Nicotiana tomentosiformis]|uniref:uncharacterized protein n=1 Tax=Nicotiana tomentosiformis TaxID=4098 RepID=UPI00388CD499